MKMQKINEIKVLVLLLIVTWGSRFFFSTRFGVYEDDHYRVPLAMAWTWVDFWNFLGQLPQSQLKMQGQGRMLHVALIETLSFFGQQLGGLHAVYFLGYCVVATNTLLFYFLLKRLSKQPFFAVSGALAFALFPADTTQAFLTHALGVQPALTLLLIGLHFYISNAKSLSYFSYFCVFITLFCYEKFFLVFLAAPLLRTRRLKLKWDLLRHILILGGMLAGVAFARRIQGESRVSELNAGSLVKIFTDTISGPVVSITTFLYRPLTALSSLKIEWLIPLGLFFIAIASVLYQTKLLEQPASSRYSLSLERPEFFKSLARWASTGFIMLALAYPLTLIGEVEQISGRASRVHVAAVIGASILCACACTAIVFIAKTQPKQRFTTLGLAAFFTLLIGFGFTIQRDYIRSWQYQQAFWTEMSRLCPDMTEGTVLLVEHYALKDTEQIMSKAPYPNRILNSIYQFPEAWGEFNNEAVSFKRPRSMRYPMIYRLRPHWKNALSSDASGETRLRLSKKAIFYAGATDASPVIDSTNTIVLAAENGHLVRRTQPINVDGKRFPLKQNNSSLNLPPFEQGILYKYIIKNTKQSKIDYMT